MALCELYSYMPTWRTIIKNIIKNYNGVCSQMSYIESTLNLKSSLDFKLTVDSIWNLATNGVVILLDVVRQSTHHDSECHFAMSMCLNRFCSFIYLLIWLKMSLPYIKIRVGSNILPCGTP